MKIYSHVYIIVYIITFGNNAKPLNQKANDEIVIILGYYCLSWFNLHKGYEGGL